MNYGYDHDDLDFPKQNPTTLWQSQHPGVRSAIVMWGLLLVVALINSFTGGTSILFFYPVQLLLYIANGYLAGYYALTSGRHPSDLSQIGAIAGFVAWILPAVYYVVFGLILGVVTFGIGAIVGFGVWLLCGPIDLAIHAILAAFGAWLYGRNYNYQEEEYW